MLAREPFDLIVSDSKMPVLDGEILLRGDAAPPSRAC